MLALFLDTGSNTHSLALCTESELLARVPLKTHGDTDLVPAIENVLKEKNFTYKDLMHLAAVIGPGGFTSLRVGVTAINMLSHTLDIPSTGIHLSDFWSGRVMDVGAPRWGAQVESIVASGRASGAPLHTPTNFLWLHSTRRTQIFVKGYGADASTPLSTSYTITPIGTFGLDDAVKLKGPYVGELIPEHSELLSECIPIPKEELMPIEEFLPQFLAALPYAKQQLLPWYGRDAD